MGHPLLITPNIDQLAKDGVSFSQAYAGAPNCSPSRAALLTGRASYRAGVFDFLHRHSAGMHLSRFEITIASILQRRGFATVHMGKWHLSRKGVGFSPREFGFTHSNGSFVPASVLLVNFVGWLTHGRRVEQPFFAYLALWEPHEPVNKWSPANYQELYTSRLESRASDSSSSRIRSTLEDLAPSVASGGGGCTWRLPQRDPPRVYYGCLSQVDASIGEMLRGWSQIRHNSYKSRSA